MVMQKFNLPPAFESLVQSHEREIMRLALRVTGNHDDALDLFQETWLRAYRAYPRVDPSNGLRPWLYSIALNLGRNYRRDRARRSRVMDSANASSTVDGAASISDAHEGREQLNRLRGMLKELPDKQQHALWMRKVGGFSYGEIGAALDCSAESARVNVSHALRKLRDTW